MRIKHYDHYQGLKTYHALDIHLHRCSDVWMGCRWPLYDAVQQQGQNVGQACIFRLRRLDSVRFFADVPQPPVLSELILILLRHSICSTRLRGYRPQNGHRVAREAKFERDG